MIHPGGSLLSDVKGFVSIMTKLSAGMSSPVHIDNRKTFILITDKGLADGLDDTKFNAEKKCLILLLIF